MAFNAKNLQYNKQEPAFLRKLKGEYAGQDGRQNYQAPRPKRDRLKAGDEDDDPLIVDEQGETVAKEEFERRMKEDEDVAGTSKTTSDGVGVEHSNGVEDATGGGRETSGDKQKERQQVSEIGGAAATKKRKVGKIVGAEDEDGEKLPAAVGSKVASTSEDADGGASLPKAKDLGATKKKKGKKIKLSFDEPDG